MMGSEVLAILMTVTLTLKVGYDLWCSGIRSGRTEGYKWGYEAGLKEGLREGYELGSKPAEFYAYRGKTNGTQDN